MIETKPVIAADVPSRTRASHYPEPFAAVVAGRAKQALGDVFRLTHFGVNRTTLKPGAQSALRHWHTIQDEFIYILSGCPTLVTDAGETTLEPGICMGFPGARADGHHLVNRTMQDVIYLEIGDRLAGDAVSYPDDDLKAVLTPEGTWVFQHRDGRPY